MKYIIMCGGSYRTWEQPRQLVKIQGETLVERTIRLLRENGVEDIAISSNHPAFESFGVPVLHHENGYTWREWNDCDGSWCDAFYPTKEPACYLFGDVFFSPEAIRKIVETDTNDIELFGSQKPFAEEYWKPWIEPFALKVQDQKHLRRAIKRTKELEKEGAFWRDPIMWELWQVIKGTRLNKELRNYTAVNDYTCDIDDPKDVETIEKIMNGDKPEEWKSGFPKPLKVYECRVDGGNVVKLKHFMCTLTMKHSGKKLNGDFEHGRVEWRGEPTTFRD